MLGRTVEELNDTMASDELSGWVAMDRVGGLPDVYFLVGKVCETLAKVFGGNDDAKPSDFVPYFKACEDYFDESSWDDDDEIEAETRANLAISLAMVEASRLKGAE